MATEASELESTESEAEYWARYYDVTAERPAWETVRFAIGRFVSEAPARPWFAVDLGCGAGRDARELLRAGWRVLAVDRQPAAIASLEARVSGPEREALVARVADLASIEVPACLLVNASLSLPFLASEAYWATWGRVLAALPVGGRVSAMLFGDRDAAAPDPSMTCPPPAAIEASLGGFEIEHWVDREEDTTTALGEPHHLHLVEVVARRVRPAWTGGSCVAGPGAAGLDARSSPSTAAALRRRARKSVLLPGRRVRLLGVRK